MQKFEQFIHSILVEERKQKLVLLFTLLAFFAAVMMFPTKIVLAKMLPGKSTNTFSIYIDLPNGSSYQGTNAVNACVVGILLQETEIQNIQVLIATHSPAIINDRWDLVYNLETKEL